MFWRREDSSIRPKQTDADLWIKIWELLKACVEKNWDLDVKYVKARGTKKEKKARTTDQKFAMEGIEKANGSAKEVAAAGGAEWQMRRLIEERKDRDEIVQQRKKTYVRVCRRKKKLKKRSVDGFLGAKRQVPSPSFDACWSGMIMSTIAFAHNERSAHMAQVDPRFEKTCVIFGRGTQVLAIHLKHAVLTFEPF